MAEHSHAALRRNQGRQATVTAPWSPTYVGRTGTIIQSSADRVHGRRTIMRHVLVDFTGQRIDGPQRAWFKDSEVEIHA